MANHGRRQRNSHRSGRPRPRGGRVTPKGAGRKHTPATAPVHELDGNPDLADPFAGIKAAVDADEPIGFFVEVSSLIAAFDERNDNPFGFLDDEDDLGDADFELPELTDLIEAFIDTPDRGATYLLTGLAQLLPDQIAAMKCRRALAARPDVLPEWLDRLGETTVSGVIEQIHVLGDGDNIILGVDLPGGHAFTFLVFVDHSLGHVCKDAFPVFEPLDTAVEHMREIIDNPDVTWQALDAATARARLSDAIERGAMTVPPYETDTWPGSRPFVEWLVRKLPDGGVGYPPEDDAQRSAEQLGKDVTDAFFASPFGAPFDQPDHRTLFELLCWFGTGYGSGDLLQWSPLRVEMLLADWLPRKVAAEADYLAKMPVLLKAFIRYCHAERGIRTGLTDETVDAVDEWTPDLFERIGDTERPAGPVAFIQALLEGDLDPTDPAQAAYAADLGIDLLDQLDESGAIDDELHDQLHASLVTGRLAAFTAQNVIDAEAAVGGGEALGVLDADPLPAEPMDWSGIPDDIRGAVEAIVAELDRACDDILDDEYRTACRRFLAAAAVGDPSVFRRRAKAANSAAALCWVIGKINGLFHQYAGSVTRSAPRMTAGELHRYFGASSSSQRGRVFVKAATGSDRDLDRHGLGDARYLVSTRRAQLIEVVARGRAMLGT